MQHIQKKTTPGCIITRITVDVELIHLGPDVLVLRLTLNQLVLDSSHQTRTVEVELDGEVRSIHLDCLAVRFVMDVFVPATERGGITRCGEEV